MPKKKVQGGEIDWFEEEVFLKIEGASEEVIRSAAFQILNHAKINIQQNGQIDTSAMWNSGYILIHGQEDTYAEARGDAESANPDAEVAPKVTLPTDALASVAFGVNYAFWQELKNPFLFPALQQTEKEMGGIIKKVKRREKI